MACPRRVLVIEDNVDLAGSLGDVLALHGLSVEIAYDGAAGIELARAIMPQAIVCDLGLPLVDGLDVARTLRRDPQLASVWLIAYSAACERAEAALAAGFDRFLRKPGDPAAIARLLAGCRPQGVHSVPP